MNLEQDVEYIVTTPSNDGTFLLGDKIVLKADGRIWIGNDFVEPVDVAAAVEGMECDTFVLTSRIPSTIEKREANARLTAAAPEMLELIQALAVGYDKDDGQGIYQRIDDFIDFTHQAQSLLAKIEGGGDG